MVSDVLIRTQHPLNGFEVGAVETRRASCPNGHYGTDVFYREGCSCLARHFRCSKYSEFRYKPI